MLPVPILPKSIIQLVDDQDTFANLADTCPGASGQPCIYPATNLVSVFTMGLGVSLLIAVLLCVHLRKRNRTKLAATVLAVPTAIAFIIAIMTIAVAIFVATKDIVFGSVLAGFSAFYLCLAGYILRYTNRVYKGVGTQNFSKIAIVTAIIALILLGLPMVIDSAFNSVGVEATR